jgi:hypothetical protein
LCSIGPVTRLTLRGVSRLLALVAFVTICVAPGCTQLQPETGDTLTACVEGDSNPAVKVSFAKDIRPLMNGIAGGPRPCADCHYATTGSQEGINESGLKLATLEGLRNGGNRTSADIIVKGSPCKSAVIQKLRGTYGAGSRMPRGGPYWTPAQIQLFMDWITEGAEGDAKE